MLLKGTKRAGVQEELQQLPEMVGAEPAAPALMAPIAGDWWESHGSREGYGLHVHYLTHNYC